MGYSLWDLEELDMTEWLTLSLSFGELGSHMLYRPKKKKKTKPENRNNIAINSIKTLKMVHIKNLFKNNKNKKQCLFLMCPTCSPWEACFLLFICNLSFPSCQHLQHSPGVSFIEFNKHSAWPSQHCPSFPTACHVNLVLCKWLLYSSPLSLKDD